MYIHTPRVLQFKWSHNQQTKVGFESFWGPIRLEVWAVTYQDLATVVKFTLQPYLCIVQIIHISCAQSNKQKPVKKIIKLIKIRIHVIVMHIMICNRLFHRLNPMVILAYAY